MASSTKVFVYHSHGASPQSAGDLKELLLTSSNIFAQRPDVQLSDFNFNVTGLTIPTFVVPGGSTNAMASVVQPFINDRRNILGDKFNFNYVGVCAGAYIGAESADLFHTPHKRNRLLERYEPPIFLDVPNNNSLGLIPDYKAIGAFYPNDSHERSFPKDITAYRVELSLDEKKEKLAQLYVGGPGFAPLENSTSDGTKVIARYADNNSYTFEYTKTEKKTIEHLPAMVRRKGVFLSATHIEACVPNGEFLKFFKSSGETHNGLHKRDYDAFISEQDETRQTVESLLRQTLK
jgi:glutamine amidotransferase-like uncharacterized protein